MRSSAVVCIALALLLPHPASTQNFSEFVAVRGPTIALTHAKVIDGTGAPAKLDQTILIEGDRITAIGASGTVRVPQNATIVDLSGQTVIPGLVGLHDHSYYTGGNGRAAQLSFSGSRLYLASGVTTIRTTGAQQPYAELNLKREIDAGRVVGPTMFPTGPYLTGEQGAETMTRLEGPDQARRVVRYWAEEGVTWFKAYTWISRAELGAAIDEAHANGVKVTAHLCSVGYREAVALGIDNLEHGLFANSEYDPNKRPDECPPGFRGGYADLDVNGPEVQATFRDMIEAGVAMTSTLVVYEISVSGRPPIDERVYDVLAPEIAAEVRAIAIDRRAGRGSIDPAVFAKAMEYERAFVAAGGLLGAGVDPTGYGAAPPGYGDQRNYELLLEAGFTAPEVVQIMSLNGARVLDIDQDVGSVTVGKVADLVVIEADLEAVGNLHATSIVFRHGVGWDSKKLIESIRGVVGIR
ncbi:MAG: amidohydrolase family protein [Gemmatimonadetes bacterium]|nr:amidohydrolase family protein [Gemmatimonadota bacterium]MDA1103920.1 amidohydrolase family protein [Gemmatimonadota bacterium]